VTAAGEAPERRTVLYDDDCGFCKWSLDKILAWDRREVLRPIPIQGAEGQRLLAAIPAAEQLDSWHVALPSGEVRSAGAAAPPIFEVLPGGRPLAWLFATFPGVTDRAYRLVAANRDRLSRLLGIDATCQVRR
jgi:predicted DCC family thiol-disulfide oxidoreductase YuxK